jgi:predicted ABC-type ATPase
MPTLFVIAGPNGIGKTTSSYDLVPVNTPIINSDEIAKEIRKDLPSSINLQEYVNHEAVRLMEEQRKEKKSFAIETNLADIETWKFLIKVQETGYELHIVYLSTGNLAMLNNRIKERIRLGDHFVRPNIVEERYTNSLKLLNHYFDKANKLQLFDNSQYLLLVGEIHFGEIIFQSENLPHWVKENLGQHFQKKEQKEKSIRDMTINEIRERYGNQKK